MAAWARIGASGPSSKAGGRGAPTRAMSVPEIVSRAKGTRPHKCLVEHEGERVDVRPVIERATLGLLGRGVAGGAENRPERLGESRLRERPGHAEVGDPQVSLVVEEQIARLDVPVDDAPAVGVGEPRRALGSRSPPPASG